MNFELFVSLRYLLAKRRQTFISLITFISIAGVAVGVTALIVVLAVMNGFQDDLRIPHPGHYLPRRRGQLQRRLHELPGAR